MGFSIVLDHCLQKLDFNLPKIQGKKMCYSGGLVFFQDNVKIKNIKGRDNLK